MSPINVRRNEGYGHPLRPEYVITAAGRAVAALAGAAAVGGDVLLRKWSVPVRALLPGVTPRALAIALRDLEDAALVRREVLPTRPPSTVYRATARGRRVVRAAP